MPCRIGVLRSESRPESVYISKGHAVCFTSSCPLTVRFVSLSKKSFEKSTVPSSFWRVVYIKGCNLEHLSCPFRVTSCDNRGMNIYKPSFLEKFMYGVCQKGPDPEHCRKVFVLGLKWAIVLKYSKSASSFAEDNREWTLLLFNLGCFNSKGCFAPESQLIPHAQ